MHFVLSDGGKHRITLEMLDSVSVFWKLVIDALSECKIDQIVASIVYAYVVKF